MGARNGKGTYLERTTVGYYPAKTVLGYKTDYVQNCGSIMPVQRPCTGIVPIPIIKVEEKEIPQQKGKLKYSDNNMKIEAKLKGNDLIVKQTCKA